MRSEQTAQLITELKGLSNRELRLTLQELKPHEREQVLALIERADRPKPAPTFESLVGLSPWLLKAIDAAKAPPVGDAAQRLTEASRTALMAALDQLAALANDNAPTQKIASGTFVGRMMARRKRRAIGS
jgi:hypothetical protein